MNPYDIIKKYYGEKPVLHKLYITHVEKVRDKALEVAKGLKDKNPDLKYIEIASLLHDIGIIKTNAPGIYCEGEEPYLMHGPIGRKILEKEGFEKYAPICERHTGCGITKEEVIANNLPLPKGDYMPKTLEEKIICFADNFYSKDPEKLEYEKTWEEVVTQRSGFGDSEVEKLYKLADELNYGHE